ncbi:MAG: YjbQ family protein [Candidatus Aureabacteria bacterium]|nr:YjbQ family protein [Candidatus Auribacterota bacterium]NLW95237.1 YjbQ family protein [Chlamydiota bacterium]HOE27607.1 secondary thiamine-phosphate synthase enzyme YjbQ [bacterium]HQM53156.1 secondary thiamine-phosphate synthase enzyme YjbQ [bacterium]
MRIVNGKIEIETKGDGDLRDITGEVARILEATKLKTGIVTVFVAGSTAAVTTFEYEPGMVQDITELYARLVPRNRRYAHDETWGDANGFSHLRAALQGPSLVVPFEGGELTLGRWQQIVLAEFDNRPRRRRLVVQVMGE